MSNLRNLIGAFSAALVLSGCGSRLPSEINIKRPVAEEAQDATRIDLTLIDFTDINTGATVNVGAWMDQQKIGFMLLTFGSRACSACNKKARLIRDNYLSDDKISLAGMESRLAIVGVNTDSDSLSLTQRFIQSEGFDFIRWSDPRGSKMLQWFMPGGRSYGVPLTVMVSRQGILWAYTNDSTATVAEIMTRARATVEGDASPHDPDDGDDGDDNDPHEPNPVALPPALAFEGADRMRDVMVSTCGVNRGVQQRLDAVQPLSYVATFFHVEREACGVICRNNRVLLQRKVESVLTGDVGAGFLYAGQAPVDCLKFKPDENEKSRIQSLVGGAEFFDAFATHFDWNHEIVETNGGALSVAPLAPAITLAFSRDGKLLFSAEGAIDEARLDGFLRSIWIPGTGKQAPAFARGPAWNFHGLPQGQTQGGLVDFSEWRNHATYSVINVFGESCSSCMAELKHWSRPDGMFDLCNKNPDFCIVGTVENGLPDSAYIAPGPVDRKEMDTYLARVSEALGARGISAPIIMLDPYSPENDSGRGYLKRFFDGYLSAKNPDLGFDFRTIVSDREGKILGVFKATPPDAGKVDHVEEFLLRLRSRKGALQ